VEPRKSKVAVLSEQNEEKLQHALVASMAEAVPVQ